jgi:hypothetical protein
LCSNVWPNGCSTLPGMRVLEDKTALIQAVERLEKEGSFAVSLGKAALLADKTNLRKLVNAFPELFRNESRSIRLVYERSNNLSEGQG